MKRSIITTTVAAVAVGIGLTSTAFAAGPWGHHDGGNNRHHVFGPIFMGLVVAAIVGLVVYLVVKRPSAGSSSPVPPSPTASAETILAERLARGEISPDDYRTMLDALKGTPTPS